MNPEAAKRLRLLASAVSVIAVLTVFAIGWTVWRVRASLPQLDGQATATDVPEAASFAEQYAEEYRHYVALYRAHLAKA